MAQYTMSGNTITGPNGELKVGSPEYNYAMKYFSDRGHTPQSTAAPGTMKGSAGKPMGQAPKTTAEGVEEAYWSNGPSMLRDIAQKEEVANRRKWSGPDYSHLMWGTQSNDQADAAKHPFLHPAANFIREGIGDVQSAIPNLSTGGGTFRDENTNKDLQILNAPGVVADIMQTYPRMSRPEAETITRGYGADPSQGYQSYLNDLGRAKGLILDKMQSYAKEHSLQMPNMGDTSATPAMKEGVQIPYYEPVGQQGRPQSAIPAPPVQTPTASTQPVTPNAPTQALASAAPAQPNILDALRARGVQNAPTA